MKKLIVLFALLFSLQEAFASGRTIANHWRWSTDEGNITTKSNASWLKPVNVAPVISMPGAYRLRLLTFADGSYTFAAGDRLILEYREEPQSNSNITLDNDGIIVNNNSSTAGSWTQVLSENPAVSTRAFAVDPGYNDGASTALKDRIYNGTTSANLLYSQEAETGTNAVLPARHENLTSGFTRRGGVGLSKNSTIGFGDPGSGTLTGISTGGLEVEYRLVATNNAKPGSVYYFRLRNVNTSGAGEGTVDSWDYAAGYPSIAISNNYMGAVDAKLPNIAVSMPAIVDALTYAAGETKSGILRISNLSAGITSTNQFRGTFTIPSGWELIGGTMPTGWTLTGNVLVGTVPLAGSAFVEIPYSIKASSITAGDGGVVSFALGNNTGNAGGDGTLFNNRSSFAVYKPQ